MFKRYWWMLLVMAPVGMMAGLMLAAVVTYVMPKKYESYVTIEIKPRTREVIESTRPAQSGGMTAIVCGTEFEVIKSRNSLSKVIDSLDLTNRWGVDRETALRILKGIVQTQNIKGTDLMQIRVRHTNKEDARDIAAETARAYKEYRQDAASAQAEKLTHELRKAVRNQEDRVEERRKILSTITSAKGAEGGSDPVDRQDYADAKREFETELSLLEQLKLKLITEEISSNILADTVVVHDDPIIADSPISPNVSLNLVAGLVGGLLLSPFLALPLMWWMNRRSAYAAQDA